MERNKAGKGVKGGGEGVFSFKYSSQRYLKILGIHTNNNKNTRLLVWYTMWALRSIFLDFSNFRHLLTLYYEEKDLVLLLF